MAATATGQQWDQLIRGTRGYGIQLTTERSPLRFDASTGEHGYHELLAFVEGAYRQLWRDSARDESLSAISEQISKTGRCYR